MKEPKLIFLFSQSPRSGHNFVADVLRILVNSDTIIGDRSEIPFGPIIENYYNTLQKSYKSEGSIDFLNRIFIKPIRQNVLIDNTDKIIKYTSFEGADTTAVYFPNEVHIISYRDPKDCLFSLFKGMRLKNDWKSKIKRALWATGIYHYQYARKYSKSILKHLPKNKEAILVRRELLVNRDKRHLEYLIKMFKSTLTFDEFSKAIDSIRVINTSFFKEETGSKGIWQSTKISKSFSPLNRDHSVNKVQLFGIKLGSRQVRLAMGYLKKN
jgi:hypothetical protein